MHSWNSRRSIVAFLCNWAPYRCYMDLCQSEASLPYTVYPIRVMCAGRVDLPMVLYAFEKGAEGVMVIGCQDKACQYGHGPHQAAKNEESTRGLMDILGLESVRFARATYSFDDREGFLEDIEAFTERVYRLPRSPFNNK